MPRLSTPGVLFALFTMMPATLHAQEEENPLKGAWVMQQGDLVVTSEGDTLDNVQPALFIFTDTHYSMTIVPDTALRATFGEDPTDAEKLEAFDNFVANAGRYEVQGDEITIRPYVAKNPNFMAGFPQNAVTTTFRVAGDRLHWQLFDGPMLILSKVEGQPFPH